MVAFPFYLRFFIFWEGIVQLFLDWRDYRVGGHRIGLECVCFGFSYCEPVVVLVHRHCIIRQ